MRREERVTVQGPVKEQQPDGMSHRGGARHNATQHNTTQHNTTQHNTTQHNTTQHNTTQHNTTQHNTTPTQHTTPHHTTPRLAFSRVQDHPCHCLSVTAPSAHHTTPRWRPYTNPTPTPRPWVPKLPSYCSVLLCNLQPNLTLNPVSLAWVLTQHNTTQHNATLLNTITPSWSVGALTEGIALHFITLVGNCRSGLLRVGAFLVLSPASPLPAWSLLLVLPSPPRCSSGICAPSDGGSQGQ